MMEDVGKSSGGEKDVGVEGDEKTMSSLTIPDTNYDTSVTESNTSITMSANEETSHGSKEIDKSLTFQPTESSEKCAGTDKTSPSVELGDDVDVILKYRDSSFSCETCGVSTASSKGFDEHIAKHILARPYICLNCMMEFESKSEAVKHAAKDHPDQQFKCAIQGLKKIDKILHTLIEQGSYTLKGKAKHLQKSSLLSTASSPTCSEQKLELSSISVESSQSCNRKTSISPDCLSSETSNSTVSIIECSSQSCSVSSTSASSVASQDKTILKDEESNVDRSSTTSENEQTDSYKVQTSLVSASSPVASFVQSDATNFEVTPEVNSPSSFEDFSGQKTASEGAEKIMSDKGESDNANGGESGQSGKTESDDKEIETDVGEHTELLHAVPQTSSTPPLHEETRSYTEMSVTSGKTSSGKTQTDGNQVVAESTVSEEEKSKVGLLEGTPVKQKVKNLTISPHISMKFKQVFKERDQRKETPSSSALIDLTEDDDEEPVHDQNCKTVEHSVIGNHMQKNMLGNQSPSVSGIGNNVVSNVGSNQVRMKEESKIAKESSLKTLNNTSALGHESVKNKERAAKKKRVFTKVGASYLCNICKSETEISEKFEEHVWIHLHVKRKICKKCTFAECQKGKTNCQIVANIMAGLKFGSANKITTQRVKSDEVVIISDDEDDDVVCLTDMTKPTSNSNDVKAKYVGGFSNSSSGVPSNVSQEQSQTIHTQVRCNAEKDCDKDSEQMKLSNNKTLNQYSTFVCSVAGCNYQGNIFQEFIEHLRSFHRYASSLICFFCKGMYKCIEEMIHHCKVNLRKVIQCPHCPTVATDRNRILEHIMTMHSGMSKQIKVINQLCCNDNFNNIPKQQINESGINVEETHKSYETTISSSRNIIKRPFSIPAGENYPRPVFCSECPFTTKTRSQLIIHITSHATLFPKFEEEELKDGVSRNITESNVETIVEGGSTKNGQQSVFRSQEKLSKTGTTVLDVENDSVQSEVTEEEFNTTAGMSVTGSECSDVSFQKKKHDSEAVYIGSEYMHIMLECFFDRIGSTDDFVCKICQSSIKSKYQIHKHVLKHLNVWLYKCGYCNYKVLESSKLHQHIHKSHGTIPFKRMKIGTTKLKSVLQKRAQKLNSKSETETSSNTISDGSDKEDESSQIDEMDCCDDSVEETGKVTKQLASAQKKTSHEKNLFITKIDKPVLVRNGDLFKCSVCGYTSRSHLVVAGHLKQHRKHKVACSLCTFYTDSEAKVKLHIKEVHGKTNDDLTSLHARTHRSGRTILSGVSASCTRGCESGSSSKSSVQSGKNDDVEVKQSIVANKNKVKSNINKFKSPVAKKWIFSKIRMADKLHKCSFCGQNFVYKANAVKHIINICLKEKAPKAMFDKYLSKANANTKEKNTTEEQNKVISDDDWVLKNIKKTGKFSECRLCNYKSASISNVKRHILNIHEEIGFSSKKSSVKCRTANSCRPKAKAKNQNIIRKMGYSITRRQKDMLLQQHKKTLTHSDPDPFTSVEGQRWVISKIRKVGKLFRCGFCGLKSLYKRNVKSHITTIHSELYKVKKTPTQPPECIKNKPIKNSKVLDTNLTTSSDSSETRQHRKVSYKCHGCKKSFPSEKIVNLHYQKGACKTLFRCPLCQTFYSVQVQAVKKHSVIAHKKKITPVVCIGNERYRRFDVKSTKNIPAMDCLQDDPSKAGTVDGIESSSSNVLNYSKQSMSRFCCVKCGFVAESIKAFQFHFNKEHASQILVCALCTQFTANSLFHLRNHTRDKHTKAMNLKFYIVPKSSTKSDSHSNKETENSCYSALKDLGTIVCKDCNYVSTSADDFNKHHMQNHKEMLLLCLNCSEFSNGSISSLIEHTKETHRNSRLKFKFGNAGTVEKMDSRKLYHCVMPHCQYVSYLRHHCKEHLFSHFNYRPFACPYCSFKTQWKHCIGRHQTSYHPGKPYSVNSCKMPADLAKMVSRLIENTNHQNSEATTSSSESNSSLSASKDAYKNNSCVMPKCDYISSSFTSYKYHLFNHFKYRPFKCIHCSYTSSFCESIDQHIKKDHPKASQNGHKYLRKAEVEETVEKLIIKQLTLSDDNEMSVSIDDHYTKKFSGKRRVLACSKCPATFFSMTSMKYHLFHQHHLGVMNCQYCDGKSYSWSKMEMHLHSCHPSKENQTVDLTVEEGSGNVHMEEMDTSLVSDDSVGCNNSTRKDLHPRKQCLSERVMSSSSKEANSRRGEAKSRKLVDSSKMSKQRPKKFKGCKQLSFKEKAEKRPCQANTDDSTAKRPRTSYNTDEEQQSQYWYSCHLCSYSSTDMHYLSRHLPSHDAFDRVVPGEKITLPDVLALENKPDSLFQCRYCSSYEDNLITARKHAEDNHPHQVVNCTRLNVGTSCISETFVNLQPRLLVEDICKMDLMRLATKLVQEGVRMKSSSESYCEAENMEKDEQVLKRKKKKISIFTKSKHMKFLDTRKDTEPNIRPSAASGQVNQHNHDGSLDSENFEGEQTMHIATEFSVSSLFVDSDDAKVDSNKLPDSAKCTETDGTANVDSSLNIVHKISELTEELGTRDTHDADGEFSYKDKSLGILELSRVIIASGEDVARTSDESKANDECSYGNDGNRDEINEDTTKTSEESKANDECKYRTDENKDNTDDEDIVEESDEIKANDECSYRADKNRDKTKEEDVAKASDESKANNKCNYGTDQNRDEINDKDIAKASDESQANDECKYAADENRDEVNDEDTAKASKDSKANDECKYETDENRDSTNNEDNIKASDKSKANDEYNRGADENGVKPQDEDIAKASEEGKANDACKYGTDENRDNTNNEDNTIASDENKAIDEYNRGADENGVKPQDEDIAKASEEGKANDACKYGTDENRDNTNNEDNTIASDENKAIDEYNYGADENRVEAQDEDIAEASDESKANDEHNYGADENRVTIQDEDIAKASDGSKANDECNYETDKNKDKGNVEDVTETSDENNGNDECNYGADENRVEMKDGDITKISDKSKANDECKYAADKNRDEVNEEDTVKASEEGKANDECKYGTDENRDDTNDEAITKASNVSKANDEYNCVADENPVKALDEDNAKASDGSEANDDCNYGTDENKDEADDEYTTKLSDESKANDECNYRTVENKDNANDEWIAKASDESNAEENCRFGADEIMDETNEDHIAKANDECKTNDEGNYGANENRDKAVDYRSGQIFNDPIDESNSRADVDNNEAENKNQDETVEDINNANDGNSDIVNDNTNDKGIDEIPDMANDEKYKNINSQSTSKRSDEIFHSDMVDTESSDHANDENSDKAGDENGDIANDENGDKANDEIDDKANGENSYRAEDESKENADDQNINKTNDGKIDKTYENNDIADNEKDGRANDEVKENIDMENDNRAIDEKNDKANDESSDLTNNENGDIANSENSDVANKEICEIAKIENSEMANNENSDITNIESGVLTSDENSDIANIENSNVANNEIREIAKNENNEIANNENRDTPNTENSDVTNDENSDIKNFKNSDVANNEIIEIAKNENSEIANKENNDVANDESISNENVNVASDENSDAVHVDSKDNASDKNSKKAIDEMSEKGNDEMSDIANIDNCDVADGENNVKVSDESKDIANDEKSDIVNCENDESKDKADDEKGDRAIDEKIDKTNDEKSESK